MGIGGFLVWWFGGGGAWLRFGVLSLAQLRGIEPGSGFCTWYIQCWLYLVHLGSGVPGTIPAVCTRYPFCIIGARHRLGDLCLEQNRLIVPGTIRPICSWHQQPSILSPYAPQYNTLKDAYARLLFRTRLSPAAVTVLQMESALPVAVPFLTPLPPSPG